MAGYKEDTRLLTIHFHEVKSGDRVIAVDDIALVVCVERKRESPTRFVVEKLEKAVLLNAIVPVIEVPSEWIGEPVTVILGKDELPEKVANALRWLESNSSYDSADVVGDWARSRWPEAFK
jgi:hypothetical protein